MKKVFSILLTAAMLCSMLVVVTMPAFAAPKKDVGVIDITAGSQLCKTLESLDDGRKVVLNIKTDMCIDHEVVIKANNCSILFYSHNDNDLKVYPNYLTDDYYRFLRIEGDNVKLYFDSYIICRGFKKTGYRKTSGSGAVIYVNGKNCLIAHGRFVNCTAEQYGGAIYTNDVKTTIENCDFWNCSAAGGGAIAFNDKGGRVDECVFENNSCSNEKYDNGKYYYGDDVAGYRPTLGDPSTVVQSCRSTSKRKDKYYQCIVNPEEVHYSGGSNIYEIFGTDFEGSYSRPIISNYAKNAMDNNKCDVIRPDKADVVKSDNGLFTLEGTNAYGALWEVTYKDDLTITAKEGYTINRIEAFIADDIDYEELSIDKGTKKAASKYGDSISSPYIAKFDDINSDSVIITISGDITSPNVVRFNEFIIYYTEGAPDNDPVAEEVSNDYMRDGETYDIFTFKKSGASSDQPNTAISEQKGFTLTDTAVPTRGHIYGWATTINITAPKGYTITHIEGKPSHFEGNVDALDSNVGTIVDKGQRLAKDGIVRINDINASSIDISCNRDYVEFDEFLVFYEEDAILGSVFSGGTLWIVIGIAVVAIAAAVMIVVKKKVDKGTK